jgi:TusA-related sulfurtransferase
MAVRFEKTAEGKYLLDVCGMVCPHPQIHTKKSLEQMAPGETLEVVFDNRASLETIRQLCEAAGHRIAEGKGEASKYVYVITKK